MGATGERRLALAIGAAYVLALVVVVSGPWGHALNRLTVRCYVLFRYDWPIAPDWAGPEDYGALLNVVLFVPLGALVVLLTRRPWWFAVAVSAAVSATVEVVQELLLPRVGSWVDLAANTLGAAIGAGAVSLASRRRGPRRRDR